ncbi:putative tetratricopeptide-like helical domain superfamily, DYW domain-containing protein [Helianthus annuus]|nr:putative tetratricopeptide-like helical domain superfamily, DYW domain-containing protein [Helianthus annuus]
MFKLKNQTLLTANQSFKPQNICSLASALSNLDDDQSIHQSNRQKTPILTTQIQVHQPSHPDPKFYISALINCKNLQQIKPLHAHLTVNGLINDPFLINKLLYMYVRYNALDDAHILFDKMPERNPVSWSVMIGGFAKAGSYINCFDIFKEYLRSGQQPDAYTLPAITRVCRNTQDLKMGRVVHHVVYKFGLHMNSFICAALVDMYAKCGVIDDARKLLDTMKEKDLTTWTVMIGAYAACGNAAESLVLFDQMQEHGGIVPDKISMVTVVNACAKLGAMNKAKMIHDLIQKQHHSLDVILGTAMIDMYAKCGSIDSAREIFDKMRDKNVITWSTMIAGYGYHGQGQKALELFPLMSKNRIKPNNVTFVSLLYACSHSGLVEDGLNIFSLMQEKYFVKPDVKHYTCMVDLLGRAGKLDQAFDMIENMKVEKDVGLWSALLSACRIYNHVEMAQKAAESLLEIQPHNPSHYVMLSNIYAKAGKWENMAKIRAQMTNQNLKKTPGFTWVEAQNKVHKFSSGDHSHCESNKIYEKLTSLVRKLEDCGYVPDTEVVLHDVNEELKLGNLYAHSEKLAIAYGLISTPEGTVIRLTKNLRVCGDCHTFMKFVSVVERREIVVRDAKRFHHVREGVCSCGDYW